MPDQTAQPISGVMAIKEYFGLHSAGEAMREVKALKAAPGYFEYFATECAKALGRPLKSE